MQFLSYGNLGFVSGSFTLTNRSGKVTTVKIVAIVIKISNLEVIIRILSLVISIV